MVSYTVKGVKGRGRTIQKIKSVRIPYKSFAAIFHTQQGNQRFCPPQKAPLVGSSEASYQNNNR